MREDPVRKGLLFAATERAVHVSFNDGEDWQPLRQNMPASSIRDLIIHENDLVIGTHGRSFWIMDDISPLRQLTAEVIAAEVHLFRPAASYRVRRSVATDTPLPPEEPTAPNPPAGAVIDYRLKTDGPVTLEILDGSGKLVRRFASTDSPELVEPKTLEIDPRWVRPPRSLAATAGSHRFVWDLHYPPPEGAARSFPISAVYGDTPTEPLGPAVMPGKYTVKLTVGGKSFTQPLEVRMDPRVTTPVAGLEEQFKLSMQCYEGMRETQTTLRQLREIRKKLAEVRAKAGQLADTIDAFDSRLAAMEGSLPAGRRAQPNAGEASFSRIGAELGHLLAVLQRSDATPTMQCTAAVAALRKDLEGLTSQWGTILEKDLAALNVKLKAAGLAIVEPGIPK